MAANIDRIAHLLGADIVDQVPETGPGYLGAARLANAVATIRANKANGIALANPSPTVGEPAPVQLLLSRPLLEKLEQLAKKAQSEQCGITPIQVAAQLLEDAVDHRLNAAH